MIVVGVDGSEGGAAALEFAAAEAALRHTPLRIVSAGIVVFLLAFVVLSRLLKGARRQHPAR